MPDNAKPTDPQASLVADPGPKRLFLIDGYSNIFRAFYAIRHLSNSKGEPTNAVFGFLQILRKLLRDEEPELIGVALDVSRKTVRSEKFPEYKANRAPMPEDLRPQIPWIRKVLEAYRIPILELPSYEADDVLGTLADKAEAAGYVVTLVSADKDLFQLVTDKVSMYHTSRDKLYTPALVEEDFGVTPSQVPDVLALMGDSSDNIPGVAGIGEKGAKTLIREYGDLENLLEHAGELKRKAYREGLVEHRQMAELSKDLATIHRDIDVAFEADQLHRDPPDREMLLELFRELEFFTLAAELEEAAASDREPAAAAREIMTVDELDSVGAALAGQDFYAQILGEEQTVGLVFGGSEGEAAYVDLRREGLAKALAESLAITFGESDRLIVGHDLKEVLRLTPRRTVVAARLFDTMLASYVLRPSLRSHALEEVALDRLHVKATTSAAAGWRKKAGEETPPEVASPDLLALAGERLDLVMRLRAELEGELTDNPLLEVYRKIEEPLIPVLEGMEERGILLDCPFLENMSAELQAEVHALEGEIYQLAGETFNINSPQQLGVVLFEKLGYPVLRRTQKTKKYATGAEILEQLAARGYPLPERILRYRELAKLKSTYVDALPALVAEDGRLHTRFNQAVAATGRLSSAHPNLQNIPVRTELGQQIRKAFVAGEGRVLLVADYSQVELRVLAHIAQEKAMLEAFLAGQDIHRATAASVFGIVPEMVSSEQRRAAKTINFGILYGMSAFGLARNLGISKQQAAEFIDAYMARYSGVKAYVEDTVAAAESEGKVETLYGRVRWLPEIRSKNRMVRENAKRMAINARIQGTAADIMKLAMIGVDRRLRDEGHEARLLLTVHDELMLELPDDELSAVERLVREEMEGVCQLDAPLVVDSGSGRSWYEAKA